MKRRNAGINLTAFILFVTLLHALPARGEIVDVTLLHTNDFHCRFDRSEAVIRTIRTLRKQYPHSLLLDAGDAFEIKVPKAALTRGEALVEFMNRAGYDVMTLGDNAFDGFTLPDIQRCMAQFTFPILNANLVVQKTGSPLALPYFVFTRNGATIGVIGIYDEEPLTGAGLLKADAVKVAQFHVKLLMNKVDCVVLLTHQGLKKDREMARKVEGIDIIVGGSSHKALHQPEDVLGTIIVQAGSHGQTIGVLQLKIDTASNRIRHCTGRLVPTASQ